jgi:glycosyltransferase involved in cell wall biosynthesis
LIATGRKSRKSLNIVIAVTSEVGGIVSGRPDVSVIIPYYNREKYIDEAVQSVLAQTLQPREIIIVNDCSSESSRRYLDRYQNCCKIVDLPVNVGLAGSRNAGIDAAAGEFMAFLDDDDVWLPHKLEVQRKYMDDHPECAIVHSAARLFFQDGREEYFKQFPLGEMWLAQALMNGYWAIIPSVLARSEVVRAVGGFDVNFRECEDRDFIIRCCAEGYRVEGIEEPLIRVRRQDQEGLTKKPWRIYRADLRMCWKHRALYRNAYGIRGILSFVIEKAQAPSRQVRYLNEIMLFLLQFVQYRQKARYRDPAIYGRGQMKPAWVARELAEKTNLLKTKFSMTRTSSDISVVIPFYNREQYIDEAVQSVLAQTLKPLEIIIVNDCSRESARRYLDRFADVCKIVDLEQNVGLAGSRNAGISAARGEFVALLDDDDIWMPEKLAVQRKYMEDHPECTMVHSRVCAFYTNAADHVFGRFDPWQPLSLAQALRDEYWAVPSTMMFRTAAIRVIDGFDSSFRECEDRDFLIRVAAAGHRIEGIPDPLIRFRRTLHGSLSEQLWTMFRAHLRVVWKHRTLYYQAYGWRGAANFLLVTLHMASWKTRYVDGAVRFLLRIYDRKWIVKPGYRDPVQAIDQTQPVTAEAASVAAAEEQRQSA